MVWIVHPISRGVPIAEPPWGSSLKPGLFISYRKHTRKARSVTQGDLEEKRSTIGLRDEWPEVKASLDGLLFYCPGGAEEFSPGFQPWETSNKAVQRVRTRDKPRPPRCRAVVNSTDLPV